MSRHNKFSLPRGEFTCSDASRRGAAVALAHMATDATTRRQVKETNKVSFLAIFACLHNVYRRSI
jgi:hypothetical protein